MDFRVGGVVDPRGPDRSCGSFSALEALGARVTPDSHAPGSPPSPRRALEALGTDGAREALAP